MMLLTPLLAMALTTTDPQVHTLTLQPLAQDGGKSLTQEHLAEPRQLHRMHAHVAADGRTVIGCELSHRAVPDLRKLLRAETQPVQP